jgi:hypothetical protein
MIMVFHNISDNIIAELQDGQEKIPGIDDFLDIMADARYNGSDSLVVYSGMLPEGFFDLRTGIAGEFLQKISNYRMKLSVVGNFSEIKSRSLADFIRESNRTGIVTFVSTIDEALARLSG